MTRFSLMILTAAVAFALAACGDTPSESPATTDTSSKTPFTLSEKPATALSVLEAKEKAEGDEITVVGRVSDIVKGFAAFTLTDDSVEYCGRGEEQCGCPTPWDYCCEEEAAKAGRMPIEMRDAKGEPVTTDSTGLRLLDLVMVKGTLAKTESGGLMIVTQDGWFRTERPDLPEGIKWPE